MATFLDLTLLKSFAGIFTWLLVFVVAFGLLELSGIFGKGKKNFSALIALSLAFLVMFTPVARAFVEIAVPWFTILAIAVFFVMFAFMAFGSGMSDIRTWTKGLRVWVTILCVVIVVFALGGAFAQPAAQQQTQQEFYVQDAPTNGLAPQQEISLDGNVEGPNPVYTQPQRSNTFGDKIVRTFTHPQVLGALFILLLGTFSIAQLGKA